MRVIESITRTLHECVQAEFRHILKIVLIMNADFFLDLLLASCLHCDSTRVETCFFHQKVCPATPLHILGFAVITPQEIQDDIWRHPAVSALPSDLLQSLFWGSPSPPHLKYKLLQGPAGQPMESVAILLPYPSLPSRQRSQRLDQWFQSKHTHHGIAPA